MESGLVEDQLLQRGAVQLPFTSLVVSTAGYAGDLLDIRLEVFGIESDSKTGLDGISITYGTQRSHVWSCVAGLYEIAGNLPPNYCSRY